jgi:lyso-ornithine lipid O-acyltransferase
MAYFRCLYRFILLILWFFVMLFYALIVRFLGGQGGYTAIRRLTKAAKIWSKGLSKILNIKIKVYGKSVNVKGLIISNHLSYIDILVAGTIFPLRFTPKSDIANWPFLGWFIRCSKPIWVDRTSKRSSQKTLNEFINTLQHNINLLIFPEGTTTDGKEGLLPFKSTTFEAAVKGNLSVYPILIHYKEDANNLISWYDDTTLFDHVWKVFGMKQIEAEVHILNTIAPPSTDRKTFSSEVHKVMDTEYRKRYSKNINHYTGIP